VVRPLGAPEWQEGGGFEFARVEKNPKKTLDACLNRARIQHIIEGKGEGHTGLEASVACGSQLRSRRSVACPAVGACGDTTARGM
jgi:hypothetical protein